MNACPSTELNRNLFNACQDINELNEQLNYEREKTAGLKARRQEQQLEARQKLKAEFLKRQLAQLRATKAKQNSWWHSDIVEALVCKGLTAHLRLAKDQLSPYELTTSIAVRSQAYDV